MQETTCENREPTEAALASRTEPFPLDSPLSTLNSDRAEAALLGSLILHPEDLRDTGLHVDHFRDERNRIIFLTLARLAQFAQPVDAMTLARELLRTGQLDDAGGEAHLLALLHAAARPGDLDDARHREADALRRVADAAFEAARLADDRADPDRIAASLDAARAALSSLSDEAALVRDLAAVPSERLDWLWPGRIPLGKLTLLAGDPGVGKSVLTLDLAARVSTGRGWPDELRVEREELREDPMHAPPASHPSPLNSQLSSLNSVAPGDVLLLGGEDHLGDTVRPRLEAAGADLTRIVAVEGIGSPSDRRAFSLATDLARLDALLASRPAAKLVVIDPVTACSHGVDSYRDSDVRALLAPLAELAARRQVAVIAVTHLNKAAGGRAIYRAMGSLAYVAAARVGWVVAKDRSDPRRRLLLPVKNNLAHDVGGLAFRLENGPDGAAVIAWEHDPVDLDVDEALDPARRAGGIGLPVAPHAFPARRRHRADEFLESKLADGPVAAAEVLEDAAAAGLTEKMLKDARKRLGVRSERQGTGWVQRLAPDRTPARDLAGAANPFDDPSAGR